MKKITSILFLLLVLMGCSKTTTYSDSFLAFDTYIEFSVNTKDEEEFNKYFKYTKKEYDKYHKLFDAYNNYKSLNNVKTINDNAGKKAVVVDKELFYLVAKSKEYYKASYGKNNIALAPVILEYKAKQEQYDAGKDVELPSKALLKKRAKCSNINDIVLNEKKNSIYLKKECNIIDVGSIAKGYATAKIANELKEKELKSGIINAGGNVSLIGQKPNNEMFKIGITDPDNIESYRMIINTSDTNIVTSGNYQRYFKIGDNKYHHIINPKTLMPAKENKSVTIVSKDGLQADFFSTEVFMLNVKQTKRLAKKFDFEYIIIDKNDKIIISDGIKDEVEIK